MDIGNIAHLIKEEEDEQTRAAVRNSIFSEVEEYILNSTLKTHEDVVKSLKDRGVDCDSNNLSDNDAVKVSNLITLVDSMQKSKDEAKKSKSSADEQIDNNFLLESNMNNTQKVHERKNQSSAVGGNEFSIFQQNDPSKKNVGASPKETNKQQPKDRKSEESIELTKEELSEIEKEAKNLGLEGEVAKGYISGRKEELINKKLKDLEPLGNIPDGYELRNVKGDGNCFYRAIAHIVRGNENNYLSIRNSAMGAVDDLLEGIKNFENLYEVHDNYQLSDLNESFVNEAFDGIPFMGIFRQASDYKGGDVKTIKNALDILAEIKQSLSADKEFGGAAELYFISVAIKRPIVIYNNDGTIAGYSPELKMFIDRNNISWLDDDDTKVMVHRKDNHFQALVKK